MHLYSNDIFFWSCCSACQLVEKNAPFRSGVQKSPFSYAAYRVFACIGRSVHMCRWGHTIISLKTYFFQKIALLTKIAPKVRMLLWILKEQVVGGNKASLWKTKQIHNSYESVWFFNKEMLCFRRQCYGVTMSTFH